MRVTLHDAPPVYLSAYHALHAMQQCADLRPGFKVVSITLLDEHPDDQLAEHGAKKTVGQ